MKFENEYFTFQKGKYYRDFTHLADDLTVLKNPHKGIYWHYIDQGFRTPAYRQDHETPADYPEHKDFPGLNHLYLRFSWVDIEPNEGEFHWEKIDDIINAWAAEGYTFAMRCCTADRYVCTPPWVFEAGAKCACEATLEPDFGDPAYLQKLENFMKAWGEKYNGNPLIEYVDVGTLGTWGEGHTLDSSLKDYPIEVKKKHILLHKKYFPDTFILINDDLVANPSTNVFNFNKADMTPMPEQQELAEFALGLNMGLRDDSIFVWDKLCFNTLRTPTLFPLYAKNAPTDLESEHRKYLVTRHAGSNYYNMIEAAKIAKATFVGFHGYPREVMENDASAMKYLANRVGYWYFVDGIDIPTCIENTECVATLRMTNRGFAPAYYKMNVEFSLVAENGEKFVISKQPKIDSPDYPLDLRTLDGGQTKDYKLFFNFEGVKTGKYELRMSVKCENQPVRLALSWQTHREDDSYALGDVEILPL